MSKALKHFLIAAASGLDISLMAILPNEHVAKEDYTEELRSSCSYLDEIKSVQRDKLMSS